MFIVKNQISVVFFSENGLIMKNQIFVDFSQNGLIVKKTDFCCFVFFFLRTG